MQSSPEYLLSLEADISRTFKTNIQEIQQTFKTICGVTDRLDAKVCVVLQKHQQQFFKVYRTHMAQIQKETRELQAKLAEKEKLLSEGEDSASVAKLTKRIQDLQKELKMAYNKAEDKDRAISTLKMQLSLAQNQIEHLENRIKKGMREAVRNKMQEKQGRYLKSQESSLDISRNPSGENLFATEIKTRAYSKNSKKVESKAELSRPSPIPQKSQSPTPEPKEYDLVKQRLTSEVKKLTKINKQLVKTNVKVMNQHSQLEEFFINCIEQTKKLVSIRNGQPVAKILYTQFNKEEKMNLLLMMLAHDQIISTVYSLVFRRNNSPQQSLLVPSTKDAKDGTARKYSSRKEYKSIQKPEARNQSFELRLPSISKSNKGLVAGRLIKKKYNLNYNDFL